MAFHRVCCSACRALLRLPETTLTPRLRCPKCKEIFEPVIDGQVAEPSESVAVVLSSSESTPPPDPDQSFFEWLADANDPLGKKPETLLSTPEPVLEAELVEPEEPLGRPLRRRERKANEARPNDSLLALVSLIAVAVVAGFAGAGYLAYRLWPGQLETDNADLPQAIRSLDKNSEPAGPNQAKVQAATVQVHTRSVDGQTSMASGFFVPGSGLVVTNARSIGQGKNPVGVSRIQVLFGSRTLGARVLGSDGDLDLALLQVIALDLPMPVPLDADTFTIMEPQAVVVFWVPEGDVKTTIASSATVSGSREVSGPRPWFSLNGRISQTAWGGPVADSSGRVIGVASNIRGSGIPAAVPIETVLAFVQNTVRSVEINGPTAIIPGGEAEAKKRSHDQNDEPMPGLPGDGFRFNRRMPPGWNVPLMPQPFPDFRQPVFPPPMMPPGFDGRPGNGRRQPAVPPQSIPEVNPKSGPPRRD